MGADLEGLNIYQQLRELIIFHGLDIERSVIRYDNSNIIFYSITSEDGLRLTLGNVGSDFTKEDVKTAVDEIIEFYESEKLETVKSLKIWLDRHANTINPWNSDEVETSKDIKPLIWKHDDSPVIGTNTFVHTAEDGSISVSFKPTEYGKNFIKKFNKYFTVYDDSEKDGDE